MGANFDFAGFKRVFEAKDAAAWTGYFAEDAEWIEYRHFSPPRAPNVMKGRAAIGAFVAGVCAQPLKLQIEDEIVVAERAVFRLWVTLEDGKRIIEHIYLYFADGKITRQIDVEAWDQ
jgi:ketosteroid isomerase-like protein